MQVKIADWVAIIQAGSLAITALSWLGFIVFLCFLFPQLRSILKRLDTFSFTGPLGTSVSFSVTKSVEAAIRAEEKKGVTPTEGAKNELLSFFSQMSNVVSGKRVLWVDDHPRNNANEIHALEELGVRVDLAYNTEEALRRIGDRKREYSAIISDMRRDPDPKAGYTLLCAVKQQGIDLPFIIYGSGNDPRYNDDALKKGAVGSTGNPTQVLKMVLAKISVTNTSFDIRAR